MRKELIDKVVENMESLTTAEGRANFISGLTEEEKLEFVEAGIRETLFNVAAAKIFMSAAKGVISRLEEARMMEMQEGKGN